MYYTHDFPIWQSTTLQGRGTWVFGVTKDDNPHPEPKQRLVLKNAWRASGRLPESTFYTIINKLQEADDMLTLRCVAEFVDGGDVMVENDKQHDSSAGPYENEQTAIKKRVAMRISSHRTFVEDNQLNTHNPTLHRVVLATRGRSMVSYTSLVDLLSAAECAAEGMWAVPRECTRHLCLPKAFGPSVTLGSIIGMSVSVTSSLVQTQRKRPGLFPTSTFLP